MSRASFQHSGLGLSICQTIVKAHGGTIHVHSRLGQGTKVVVRLTKYQGEGGKECEEE